MRAVKFAVFALPTFHQAIERRTQAEFMTELVELLVSAEELGFDAIWANEHHFDGFGGLIPSPPIMLSHLAARTKRVRLGTSVVVLPLHNPVEIAEQLAMIDLLSGGRLEFGIGRGFVQRDYEVLGIPFEEGQERTLEGLEIVLKAWSGERFAHDGKHYKVAETEVWPRPVQRPHPPVWIACATTPESFRWTGEQGYSLLTVAYIKPIAELAGYTKLYRDAWIAAGRDPKGYEYSTHFQVVVDEDGAKARSLAEEALRRYLEINLAAQTAAGSQAMVERYKAQLRGLSIDQLVAERRVIAGSPAECAELIRSAQQELGFTICDCNFVFGGIDLDVARNSMKLFARGVIPALRSAEPALAR